MREGHISRAFDGALAALHLLVLEMGGLVQEQVREAAQAFNEWDPVAAEHVIDREVVIGAYDNRFYRDHVTLIARRAPVAGDLRAIVALSKIVTELGGVDAEARKIARFVLKEGGRPARGTTADVRHSARLAIALLRRALDGLDSVDGSAAAEVLAQDEDLDLEYAGGIRRLLTRAMEDPRQLESAIDCAFVLKSLEHVGDYARNIAQHVQSMASELPVRASEGVAPTPEASGSADDGQSAAGEGDPADSHAPGEPSSSDPPP